MYRLCSTRCRTRVGPRSARRLFPERRPTGGRFNDENGKCILAVKPMTVAGNSCCAFVRVYTAAINYIPHGCTETSEYPPRLHRSYGSQLLRATSSTEETWLLIPPNSCDFTYLAVFWILNDKYERKTLVRDSTNSCTNRLLDNKNTLLQVSWFYFDSTFPRQLFRNYGRSDSTRFFDE